MQRSNHVIPFVTGIALFLLPALCNASADTKEIPVINTAQAAAHVGKQAKVCGTVVDARHAIKTKGQPTYLNMDKPYPHPTFTAVIWGKDRGRFGMPPNILYRGRTICVTGKISIDHGTPEIVVQSPTQIGGN